MSRSTAELVERLKALSPMPADDSPDLTPERVGKYEELVTEVWQYVVEQGAKDRELLHPLIMGFGYGDGFGLYWTTRHILEKYPLDELRPALLAAVETGERGARMWSMYMLGIQRHPKDLPVFLRGLTDAESEVRYHAVMALGSLGNPDAIPSLERLLQDPVPKVRKAVQKCLGRLKGKYISAE